ncbi:MAG: hypothetical protein AAGE52_40195 [Myxococcota bacterium]
MGVLLGGNAHAQSSDETRARAVLRQALERWEAGDLETAESLMRESLGLHRWTFTAFKLGELLLERERPASAIELLNAIAAGDYGEITAEAVVEVRNTLDDARGFVPRLRLRFSNAEEARAAEVELDGEVMDVEPDEGVITLQADPGVRRVRVDIPGRGPQRFEVEFALQREIERVVSVSAVEEGRLRIDAPEGALVRVGGEPRTLPVDLRLPAGEYDIVVVMGDDRREETVEVDPDGDHFLEFSARNPRRRRRIILGVLGVVAAGAIAGFLIFRPSDNSLPVDPTGT